MAACEPIAIVGVSLKLPQEAVDEASLWGVLDSAKNLRTEWPEGRIVMDSFVDGCKDGLPNTVRPT